MHTEPKLQTPLSLRIGEIRCSPLIDGTFTYPANWFFRNIADAREELRSRNLPLDEITTPYSCLLVETGTKRVLIDTGAGTLAPTTGQVLFRLQEHGLSAKDIDVVILTHGHPDHIGGAVGPDGKPAFPNARYVMTDNEWNFWTSDQIDLTCSLPDDIKQLLVSVARRALPPIREQLELVERPCEIVTGVHCIPAPGHTPGHLAVLITSGRDQLLHAADAVLHPLHAEHPEWQSLFDLDPDDATTTRRKLLDRAATEDMLLMAYHFLIPNPGMVRPKREGWKWEPINSG